MEERGEAWLTQGLSFITDDTCPFCTQSLIPIDIVPVYTKLFASEYRALRDQVGAHEILKLGNHHLNELYSD